MKILFVNLFFIQRMDYEKVFDSVAATFTFFL
jgi:hypothetical protein